MVEVREAPEEQETKESAQTEDRVGGGLVLSDRKPGPERDGDEKEDWTGAALGGRKRIALGDIGEVGDFSEL